MTKQYQPEDSFKHRTKTALDNRIHNLPLHTTREIARIRTQALQQHPEHSGRISFFIRQIKPWEKSLGVVFAALAVITVLLLPPSTPEIEPLLSDDNLILLLSDTDDLEFYEQLEFYQWLDEVPVDHELFS